MTELGGNTAGVTYSDEELYLVLTVLRDEDDGKHYFAAMHYESATGTDKTTGFTNEYDSGSLSVTKNITGNMADMDKEFAFTITFTGPAGKVVNSAITVEKPDGTTEVKNFVENALTYTINLGNEDTVKFTNLPTGVTYTVSENNENYTQKDETYSDSTKTIGANDNDTYTITNELTTTVDTGISVDSIPYIVLALVSVIGLAVFFSKKRVIE